MIEAARTEHLEEPFHHVVELVERTSLLLERPELHERHRLPRIDQAFEQSPYLKDGKPSHPDN